MYTVPADTACYSVCVKQPHGELQLKSGDSWRSFCLLKFESDNSVSLQGGFLGFLQP